MHAYQILYLHWHGATTRVKQAHADPTLNSCTRYPLLLSDQRQCGFKVCSRFSHMTDTTGIDPRPLDLGPNTLATQITRSSTQYLLSIHASLMCLSTRANPAYMVCTRCCTVQPHMHTFSYATLSQLRHHQGLRLFLSLS